MEAGGESNKEGATSCEATQVPTQLTQANSIMVCTCSTNAVPVPYGSLSDQDIELDGEAPIENISTPTSATVASRSPTFSSDSWNRKKTFLDSQDSQELEIGKLIENLKLEHAIVQRDFTNKVNRLEGICKEKDKSIEELKKSKAEQEGIIGPEDHQSWNSDQDLTKRITVAEAEREQLHIKLDDERKKREELHTVHEQRLMLIILLLITFNFLLQRWDPLSVN